MTKKKKKHRAKKKHHAKKKRAKRSTAKHHAPKRAPKAKHKRKPPRGGLDLKKIAAMWRSAGKPGTWIGFIKRHKHVTKTDGHAFHPATGTPARKPHASRKTHRSPASDGFPKVP